MVGVELRRGEHAGLLMRGLNELMNSTPQLADITLACEGGTLKAHKAVLSACSPYFKNLIVQYTQPFMQPVFIIRAKIKHLQAIIDFMYSGETHMAEDDLNEFLQLADLLQVVDIASGNRRPMAMDYNKFAMGKVKGAPHRVSLPKEPTYVEVSLAQETLETFEGREEVVGGEEEEAQTEGHDQEQPDFETTVMQAFDNAMGPDPKVSEFDIVQASTSRTRVRTQRTSVKRKSTATPRPSQAKRSTTEPSEEPETPGDEEWLPQEEVSASEHGSEPSTTKQRLTCNICHRRFKLKQTLRQHWNRFHANPEGVWRHACRFCDGKFYLRCNLEGHLRQDHPSELSVSTEFLPCSVCQRVLHSDSALKKHMSEKHTGKHAHEKFECGYCGKSFANKYSLKQHELNTHLEDSTPFPCSLCGMTVKNKMGLKYHYKNKCPSGKKRGRILHI